MCTSVQAASEVCLFSTARLKIDGDGNAETEERPARRREEKCMIDFERC
jgi:hypothetical protein